jgi:type I restriction enzyme R subunit
MPLLELIVKTGIANAINSLPNGLKGNKNAIAETIENNVRSKIIKEHLNDPAYYDKMSALLDEIIAMRKAKAIEYEEYLQRIAELAKKVEVGQAEDTPEAVNTPGRRALYNNIYSGLAEPTTTYGQADKDEALELTIKIDETIKQVRPDDWRGIQAKEQVIKAALYGILQDVSEVERIFFIIAQHKEY